MLLTPIQILLAYIIDLIVGDPKKIPHPVIMMGNSISWLEKMIRKNVQSERRLKVAGLLFPLVISGGSFLVVWVLLFLLSLIHPFLSWVVEIWLISTTIATKGLKEAAQEIYNHLAANRLTEARKSLSMVVGRDTDKLNKEEVSRGAVETVAENIVDGIISPLFFALIGGAPLAFLYRATNTLDSMVGYKNEKYKNLGWASARFDDVLNFIPARVTGFLIIASAGILRMNTKMSFKMMRRDAMLHPSPNAGYPEAAVGGALGIQLGGLNYYQGVPSNRAKMGEATRPINQEDILLVIRLMYVSSSLFVLLTLLSL